MTTLLRALDFSTNTALKDLFKDIDTGDTKYIDATIMTKMRAVAPTALIEVFRRFAFDLATVDNAQQMSSACSLISKRFGTSYVTAVTNQPTPRF